MSIGRRGGADLLARPVAEFHPGSVAESGVHCGRPFSAVVADYAASSLVRSLAGTGGQKTGLRTFLVEDSAAIVANLTASLEELAAVEVVGQAADEATALRELSWRRREIDLVIVDVFLESGSGLGLLRGAARCGMTARWVVLTNYATGEIRRKCLELGADRVFDKSCELEELMAYCNALAADSGPD